MHRLADRLPSPAASLRIALAVFVVAWLVALWLLPGWIVALAFAAWVVKVAPGVRDIHRGFQNVRPDEEPG